MAICPLKSCHLDVELSADRGKLNNPTEAFSQESADVDLHISMCNNLHMATNLALDDRLIEEARRAGRHKTKKDAVTAALEEYVKRRKQLRILNVFGQFDFDPAYDYKAERRGRRP